MRSPCQHLEQAALDTSLQERVLGPLRTARRLRQCLASGLNDQATKTPNRAGTQAQCMSAVPPQTYLWGWHPVPTPASACPARWHGGGLWLQTSPLSGPVNPHPALAPKQNRAAVQAGLCARPGLQGDPGRAGRGPEHPVCTRGEWRPQTGTDTASEHASCGGRLPPGGPQPTLPPRDLLARAPSLGPHGTELGSPLRSHPSTPCQPAATACPPEQQRGCGPLRAPALGRPGCCESSRGGRGVRSQDPERQPVSPAFLEGLALAGRGPNQAKSGLFPGGAAQAYSSPARL